MYAPTAILSILGLSGLAIALPSPSPADVSPAGALVCEAPTGDCTLVGTCEYCCVGAPGVDRCHTHGETTCGDNGDGLVYHCDDEHA